MYIVQQWRELLDANRGARGVWRGGFSAYFGEIMPPVTFHQGVTLLVHFGKIHAVGKLQAGDLPGVVLNFQICRHQRNVNRLALSRAAAFGTNAV